MFVLIIYYYDMIFLVIFSLTHEYFQLNIYLIKI